MHIIKHFITITRHRHKVMHFCFRCGLYKQGLLHDLSKYSFVEFFNGAKYYQGTASPHHLERQAKGYSEAWMHHFGRNKHHGEYWLDFNKELGKYAPVPMPDRYIAESICDRIAASMIYSKKNYTRNVPYDYFVKNNNDNIIMHEETRKKILFLLEMYKNTDEKTIFKYLKKNYRNK